MKGLGDAVWSALGLWWRWVLLAIVISACISVARPVADWWWDLTHDPLYPTAGSEQ